MYQPVKRIFLLSPLLLLISAAPATRPADQLIVQVRRVEFAVKPGDPPVLAGAPTDLRIPADAKELSSLQTTASFATPFETVAVINGTTYRFAGTLKPSSSGKSVGVSFEYLETRGQEAKSIVQLKTNLMVKVDEPIGAGVMHGGDKATVTVLTLKRP